MSERRSDTDVNADRGEKSVVDERSFVVGKGLDSASSAVWSGGEVNGGAG